MNLEKIKSEITRFNNERNWSEYHSVKNLSMALSVEASELLEIFQWMKEQESNDVSQKPAEFIQVKNELADIFVYLLQIIMKLDIDLEAAVNEKMKLNAEKYPIEKALGNSKKYTQY